MTPAVLFFNRISSYLSLIVGISTSSAKHDTMLTEVDNITK